jgi:subtilisin family serine protease
MPLRSLGVEEFLREHPTYDGRGVLIAILDGGVDPGVPGLARTSTGERKVIDVVDFSGEGRVALEPLDLAGDGSARIGGRVLAGMGRIRRLASPPFYGGVLREGPLGQGAAADLNGDGDADDVFPVVVARASDGWVVSADADGDGSLTDERAVHDFAVAGETLGWGSTPMTLAAKLSEEAERPVLDLYFDNSSHGTHVAGIAAGHDLFAVDGFDGAAPGAQVLAIKIADNGRGKISVTGSMERALHHAAAFASRRRLPLVVNLSYGVGNEVEGTAAIDSVVNAFALEHQDVAIVISAGNVGPGVSTLGFPASADRAIAVCALLPGVFARPPDPDLPPEPDIIGWWSARGGELAKPDLCAPGVAFSNVPSWRTGEEISAGTSMAAPQIAGGLALLMSAMGQEGRRVRASDLRQALAATATPVPGATVIDMGAGVPNLGRAYAWLRASHQGAEFVVRALPDGGNTSRASGAYRRGGLRNPSDTIQRFSIAPVAGQPVARLLLRSDARWLHGPAQIELRGEPVEVALRYDATRLQRPGLYVGTVWGRAATDTLAGPLVRLTNTIVVPHPLDQPLDTAGSLGPGDVARFFVSVPPDAGGLGIELAVAAESGGTLYLFEPDGQPYRGGGRVEAQVGEELEEQPVARIQATAESLRPGVYEAVVVAPPARDTEYRLHVALPAVEVAQIASGPSVVVRNRSAERLDAAVSGDIIGAVRTVELTGHGADPESVRVDVPGWARELVVDVSLGGELWSRITDFGVTLFDDAGRPIADGPLNHAFGRLTLPLDSTRAGRPVAVELLPAFAAAGGDATWRAAVTVALRARESVPLELLNHPEPAVTLEPGASFGLQFAPEPGGAVRLEGYHPLVRVTAEVDGGPASVRVAPGSP